MSLKILSTEGDVLTFLSELKEVLTDPIFNISIDLDILSKKKTETSTDSYTTFNTMQALGFDRHDVKN